MVEQGVQPNAYSYSTVINACAKAGDVAAACQHLAEMEHTGVQADVVVYSGVLDACAKASDAPRAKLVFEQMKARGIEPNVVTYASLARPSAHNGDWEEVERLAKDRRPTAFLLCIHEHPRMCSYYKLTCVFVVLECFCPMTRTWRVAVLQSMSTFSTRSLSLMQARGPGRPRGRSLPSAERWSRVSRPTNTC